MRLDKNFYLGSIYGGIIVGLVCFVAGGVQVYAAVRNDPQNPHMGPMIVVWFLLGTACVLWGSITSMVLLYKSWDAIQDGQARTTPGKAVGFMFIPFFNLYWMFQAIYGFAVDYNKYVQRRNLTSPRLNENLFLAAPLLQLGGLVPFLGILLGLAGMVVTFMLYAQMLDAVNNLSGPRASAQVARA